jgi:hypothetical protein
VAEWGDTSIVSRSNKSSFSLSRSLLGHSARDYQGFKQEKIGRGETVQSFFVMSGILGN